MIRIGHVFLFVRWPRCRRFVAIKPQANDWNQRFIDLIKFLNICIVARNILACVADARFQLITHSVFPSMLRRLEISMKLVLHCQNFSNHSSNFPLVIKCAI